MKIVVRYSHERIKPDCRASEKFTVETPVPQDGFYIPQTLRCAWCNVDAYVESAVLVDETAGLPPATIENLRSKPADRIDPHKLTLTAGEDIPAGALVEVDPGTGMLRNHVVEGVQCACEPKNNHFCYRHRCTPNNCTRNMDSKIEEFREVRERLMWDGDTTVVPTQDGTPLSRKMFVETLCVAQARIGNSPYDQMRGPEHLARLQVLIDIFEGK